MRLTVLGAVVAATAVALLGPGGAEGVKWSKCQVAAQLLRNGFQRKDLPTWVCIAMGESSGNTRAINRHNTDGSVDYGLFQINNRYWCSEKGRGKGCNISCKSLLDDNIADDSKCARHIAAKQGLDAWVAYKQKCKGKNLSQYNVKPC
ncbi:hypothetical protein R5R35_013049 [Gryllus longicercus]|uniref:lysozyme n=1 Tax=Gryllus longicercus TaxID=2509291 RepID=A0AAN9V324_9ORTH